MYALIGKMRAVEGKADELSEILIAGLANMLGCLSYRVAKHNTEDNSLWVTEVWEDSSKHAALLTSPSVIDAISKGRP